MTPKRSVVLFHTSNHAFRAEKLLGDRAIPCSLVPVPRQLSSDCGVCLRVQREDRERVIAILAAGGVEVAGVHDV
ncbi:MAG: DUF3343 domain-containing protein [Candidatus Eisenbacteria bacterium]